MKKLIATLALAGLGAFSATAANAQGTETTGVVKPISIKLGGNFISDGDTRKAIGNPLVNIGVTYDFGKTVSANPLIYSAYLDYFIPRSKKTDGVDARGEAIALGGQVRYLIVPPGAGSFVPYGGVGLGIYNARVRAEAGGDTFSKNTTGVGGKLFLGAELASGILGEIDYNFIPKINVPGGSAKFSGFGARIGYRF
jgi:hypothetical protein